MAKTIKVIRSGVRQLLRDPIQANIDTDFSEDELNAHIKQVKLEISQRNWRAVKETLTICNRLGTATATTADHLIDTTNAHFVAGDVGKTVYNSTDKTTAKVTVYNSTSDLTIDTDIMVSGEAYYLYHLDGTSGRDLDISSITDLIEVEEAEYPTRQWPREKRNVKVFGDVLTLNVESEPTDGDEVFLYCHKVHQLTESTSTLKQDLEEVLIQGVVGLAALAWCNKMRSQIVPQSYRWHHTWARDQYAIYQRGLASITKKRVWEFYPTS